MKLGKKCGIISVLFVIVFLNMSGNNIMVVHANGIREEVVQIAVAELGYKEKMNADILDDFEANAGSANYTKYARDIGVTNGLPWGATFFWWCMCSAGVPYDVFPRSVVVDQNFYKNRNKFGEVGIYTPQAGDCIFMADAENITAAVRMGIVEKVTDDSVTFILGNWEDQVSRRTLSLTDGEIYGYGIMDYSNPYTAGWLADTFCAGIVMHDAIVEQGQYKSLRNMGENVVLWDGIEETDTRWLFTKMGDDTYVIQSLYDGRVLSADGSLSDGSINVAAAEKDLSSSQKWYIYSCNSHKGYKIVPQCAQDKRLDVTDNFMEKGTNVRILESTVTGSQRFELPEITYAALDKVSISPRYEKEMLPNEKQTLQCVLVPEDATANVVKWTSNNPDLIEVDENGNITAKKIGMATVTCTSLYDDYYKDSVTISVVENMSQTEESTTEKETPVEEPVIEKDPTAEHEQPVTKPAVTKTESPVKKGTKIKSGKFNFVVTDTKNKTVKVTGIRDKKAATASIPAKITYRKKIYKVTAIAQKAFKGNTKLKNFTIGNNVKIIESHAFSGCKNLQKVTIGKNVTTIGERAFYNCKSLNNITFKTKKLKKIGKKAFCKIGKKPVVYAPENKIKDYKKLLKGKM